MTSTVRKPSIYAGKITGGESGIRTHVRVSPKHAFQACAFSHSAISPALQRHTGGLLHRREHALERTPSMGFKDFIRERRYLNNVSPPTVSWNTHAFRSSVNTQKRHVRSPENRPCKAVVCVASNRRREFVEKP